MGHGVSGLLERDHELAALDSLVRDAASGQGSAVVIAGAPGIGRSALVRAAAARARAAGLRTLAVRLDERDAVVPFGVVRDLLTPELVRLPAPPPADDPVRDVLGPGDPAGSPREHEPASLSSTLHALYWVIADLATTTPLFLAVDDAHWADEASLRFVDHLVRRIEGLPVALLLTTRRSGEGRSAELLRQADLLPREQVLQPAPLSRTAVTAMTGGAPVDALHAATAGNPRAVQQLLTDLAEAGVDATDATESLVHRLAARAFADDVRRTLARLRPGARHLAEALATVGDLGGPAALGALVGLDLTASTAAHDELVAADVVRDGPSLAFRHEVLGEAVRRNLTAERRDDLATGAARALLAGRDAVGAAAHLLGVAPRGDAWVVGVLVAAAQDAVRRGAPDVAVPFLDRALAEPPPADTRSEVLAAGGRARLALGRPDAVDLLTEAVASATTARSHALVAGDLAQALVDSVRLEEAAAALGRAAAALRAADPSPQDDALADELELQRLMFGTWEPTLRQAVLDELAREADRPRQGEYARRLALLLRAMESVASCAPAASAVDLLERALSDDTLFRRSPSIALIAVPLLATCGRPDQARRRLDAMLTGSLAAGALPIVRAATGLSGQLSMWEGDVLAAETDGWAMQALIEEGELGPPYLLGFLTDALLAQDRADDAAAALSSAGLLDAPLPDIAPLNTILWARGRVHLAHGERHAGLADLLLCGERQDRVGQRNGALVPWREAAVAALRDLGRHDDAVDLADEELALARGFGADHAVGAALRVRATAGPGPADETMLEEARSRLEGTSARLVLTRVTFDLAAAAASRGDRAAARAGFALCVAQAQPLGATALATRATTGLVEAGGRPRRAVARGTATLTPSERQVAEAAAGGASNRDIARTLFVTEKTVETHLSSCFRKLGVRSRTQLAAALS